MENILAVKNKVTLIKNVDGTQLKWTLNKPTYQNGRCLNLGPAIRKSNVTRDILRFQLVSENIPENVERVKVVFQDPINGGGLLPIVFEMKGDAITIDTKPEKKRRKFQTKISKSEHVKGDPNYDCEDYSEENTYGQCIEAELVSKTHTILLLYQRKGKGFVMKHLT